MQEFMTICGRVHATCLAKFPAALADPPRFWEWAKDKPLYQEFRTLQGRMDDALGLGQQVSQFKSLATEWGRKYLELAKGFEVACRGESGP